MTLNEIIESGRRAVGSCYKFMCSVAEQNTGAKVRQKEPRACEAGRKLAFDYIVKFDQICAAHKIKFAGQEYYAYGLCKMLDPDDPDVAAILPYLLMSYIYNSQPNRKDPNRFLESMTGKLTKRTANTLGQEKLYGAVDLDEDDIPGHKEEDDFTKDGVGMLLYNQKDDASKIKKLLKRQAERFFLETKDVQFRDSGYPEFSDVSKVYMIPANAGAGLRMKFKRLKNRTYPLGGEKFDPGYYSRERHLDRPGVEVDCIYDVNLIQDIFVAWYQAICAVLKERNETNQSRYPDALKCGILLLSLFHSLNQPNWSESHWYFMQGLYDAVTAPADDGLDMPQIEESARNAIHQEIMDYDFWSDSAPEEADLIPGEGGADVDVIFQQPKPKRGRPKKLGGRIDIQVVSAEQGKEEVLDEQVFDTVEEANRYIREKWASDTETQ